MPIIKKYRAIADADIPAAIARDAEFAAADAAHAAAIDPHPQYLTQTEGDGRYRQSSVAIANADIPPEIARDAEVVAALGGCKILKLTGTTNSVQGNLTVAPHGLVGDNICGFFCKIFHLQNWGVPSNYTRSPGYYFEVYQDDTRFVIVPSSDSSQIVARPFSIVVFYI